MRLWSLHPAVLDRVGLVALWREGLLARKVLTGATHGYRSHPQLTRFRACAAPVSTMDAYLHAVQREATRRGYSFDASKLGPKLQVDQIPVTTGQLDYEMEHLFRKVMSRAPDWAKQVSADPHPLFVVTDGGVEHWERPRS
jgi:hypothetical protein